MEEGAGLEPARRLAAGLTAFEAAYHSLGAFRYSALNSLRSACLKTRRPLLRASFLSALLFSKHFQKMHPACFAETFL